MLEPNEVKVVQMNFQTPNAKWWSTQSPTVYRLTAAVYKSTGMGQIYKEENESLDDSLSTNYGMRTISVQNGQLTLNGHPVFLKGVNWHEEMPGDGRSMTIPE